MPPSHSRCHIYCINIYSNREGAQNVIHGNGKLDVDWLRLVLLFIAQTKGLSGGRVFVWVAHVCFITEELLISI